MRKGSRGSRRARMASLAAGRDEIATAARANGMARCEARQARPSATPPTYVGNALARAALASHVRAASAARRKRFIETSIRISTVERWTARKKSEVPKSPAARPIPARPRARMTATRVAARRGSWASLRRRRLSTVEEDAARATGERSSQWSGRWCSQKSRNGTRPAEMKRAARKDSTSSGLKGASRSRTMGGRSARASAAAGRSRMPSIPRSRASLAARPPSSASPSASLRYAPFVVIFGAAPILARLRNPDGPFPSGAGTGRC